MRPEAGIKAGFAEVLGSILNDAYMYHGMTLSLSSLGK